MKINQDHLNTGFTAKETGTFVNGKVRISKEGGMKPFEFHYHWKITAILLMAFGRKCADFTVGHKTYHLSVKDIEEAYEQFLNNKVTITNNVQCTNIFTQLFSNRDEAARKIQKACKNFKKRKELLNEYVESSIKEIETELRNDNADFSKLSLKLNRLNQFIQKTTTLNQPSLNQKIANLAASISRKDLQQPVVDTQPPEPPKAPTAGERLRHFFGIKNK